MRCRKCNVDVPEFYKKCPLCNETVFDDENKIQNIKTAEFPKIKEIKTSFNIFPYFVSLWAIIIVLSTVLYKTGTFSAMSASITISALPMIWTFIFRPVFIRQYYAGNYIIMNIYPASLFVCLSGILSGTNLSYYSFYINAVITIVCLILLIYIIIRKKDCHRSSSYFILIIAFSLALTLISVIKGVFTIILVFPIILCIVAFLLLYSRNKRIFFEEIKAKFSIQ